MKTSWNRLLLQIAKAFNVLMIVCPLALSWLYYYQSSLTEGYELAGNVILILLCSALYVLFARLYDGFHISIQRKTETIYSQALAAAVMDGISYVIFLLLMRKFPNILVMVGVLFIQVLMSMIWAVIYHKWYFHRYPPAKSIVVYGDRTGLTQLIPEYSLDKKFDVEKTISLEECLKDLDALNTCKVVFLSGINSLDRNVILKHCIEHRILVYVIPRLGDVIMSGAKSDHLFHLPLLRVGRYYPTPEFLAAKRLFDIVVSGIAALVFSPLMAATAIAVKSYDGGPVFYKQTRLTKDGKEFGLLKFRSMRVDAEANGVARLSSGENDPRITPVGRFIRKCRLDELPQLLNILKGDMSIVGPRPERPQIAAQYEEVMPEFRLRLQAKAGLTGYAQVYGKYNTTPYDKLMMDLMYISHPSILEDLRLCFATVKILFQSESTEGIAENQTTALAADQTPPVK